MSTKKFPYGKALPFLVEVAGFPDGRLIQFEIWMKNGQIEKQVDMVNGVIRGNKGRAKWMPPQKEQITILTKEEINDEGKEEEFYFIAKIDGLEIKSDVFKIMCPLVLQISGENGHPIDGADYEISFADGSKEVGKLQSGFIKIKDAPRGKFDLKIDRYKLKTE